MTSLDRRNVLHEFGAHALSLPDASALQIGTRSLTYGRLHAAVLQASQCLHQRGVVRGDTVALRLADPFLQAAGMLALMRMGATPMPLSPGATPLQVQELVDAAQAQWLLAEHEGGQLSGCCVLPFSEAAVSAIDLDHALQDALWVAEPAAACLLITGSGTTGQPRLMAVTHAQMRARLAMQQARYAVAAGDRCMVVTPLHFSVSAHNVLAAWFAGAAAVVWDQRGNLALAVASARPDVLSLTLMHAEQLLGLQQGDPSISLAAIRVVTLTSSTISQALRQRLRDDLHTRLHIVYGSNEVYAATVVFPENLDEIAEGVGRAEPGVMVEIVDPKGCRVDNHDVGQVRVKSPAQIDGYLQGSDAERFRDGWFYPGDLAKWAPCGQLMLMGRADEMMIMNGVNIYPAEIELALGEHPAVREVVAFPLRHEVAQEVPVCVVSLHEGARLSKAELLDFARVRLGSKAPVFLAVTEVLPRNVQGKPVRAELHALIGRALQDATPSAQSAQALIEQLNTTAALTPHQRRRRMAFDFVLPESLRLEKLKYWRIALSGEVGMQALVEAPVDLCISHKAVLLADEIWRIVAALLLAARVPLFGAHRLLSCKPAGPPGAGEGSGWRAEVDMPLLEVGPPETWGVALKAAFLLEAWTREHHDLCATHAAGHATFFAWVEQHALAPLRVLVPGGASTLHVLRAAFDLDVPFVHLGAGSYQLGWGARARRINRSSTDRDSVMGMQLAHRKDLTARLLRAAGLPGAVHEVVNTLENASAAAQRIGWPVVVKPVDAERGEGVHVDVRADGLHAAFAQALKHSPARLVLVEQQIHGICHRIFVAHGHMLYAVKRLPLGVYGDGASSVSQLVAAARVHERFVPPWKRSPLPTLDDLALVSLAQQGLQVESVPGTGRFVALRRIESTGFGGVDEDVTATIHPENLRVALAAAQLCGLDAAGVDLISSDITAAWHTNGAVINEVNFAPLLGEGVISRQHVQTFVTRLLKGDGRIPVEVYVGNEAAVAAARQRVHTLHQSGLATALTSHDWTEAPDGQAWHLAAQGLHARIRALVLYPNVDALVVVVQTDELLDRDLPLEGVDAVHLVDGALIRCRPDQAQQRRRTLLHMLQAWTRPQKSQRSPV